MEYDIILPLHLIAIILLDVVPNNLENPLQVITIVPKSANPGDIIPAESGDINLAVQATGTANATVQYKVIDPTSLTGDRL